MKRSKRILLQAAIIILGVLGIGYGLAVAAQPANRSLENPIRAQVEELELLYRFTGVTDDGEQGSGDRKVATVVHCTNYNIDYEIVEVRVYEWNGIDVYTSTADLGPGLSGTWATQSTEIYTEYVFFGGFPGTGSISQGVGEILSTNPNVICAAQVLDPLNSPPKFVVRLDLFDKNGILVGDTSDVYLPAVKKNLPTN